MMDKSAMGKWIFENVGGLFLDLAINNVGVLRDFLRAEALKTTNRMDDMLVDIVVDYLHDLLEDIRDEV